MDSGSQSSVAGSIVVAGDICLDVVGIPIPPPPQYSGPAENWRLTGETRTHYLLGGAMLLERWVRDAAPEWTVTGHVPCRPEFLANGKSGNDELSAEEFLDIAERLTRDEIVRSLLELDWFREGPESGGPPCRRIRATYGYSGPMEGDPSLKVLPPKAGENLQIIVLDDTGNRFRQSEEHWPAALSEESQHPDAVVIYKLHRPLPAPHRENCLWRAVSENYPEQRIAIITVNDLRVSDGGDSDASISRGLSWERTALDAVWQLLHNKAFVELRNCPHLIIRLGLDGAVYWRQEQGTKPVAWLVYDPEGIEGTGERRREGTMVGYGSVFTAALVGDLAKTCKLKDQTAAQALQDSSENSEEAEPVPSLIAAIKAGLIASRQLLKLGFGSNEVPPNYPGKELFDDPTQKNPYFADHQIPIIPGAAVPDRAYWRLLDSIFREKRAYLHKAVALTATGAKPKGKEEEEADDLFKQAPRAVFAKALCTYDRREIENYRALYRLMLDYISKPNPPRPLSVAVFGPPGAGKSFGVKQVARALEELEGPRPIKTRTFNLSQYERPDQLSSAFHLVRDVVLDGKIPLVFFDEFDTRLGQEPLGWLRYFLTPMQDGLFLDDGTPHPIGQAIFVFAGGTCGSYGEFAQPFLDPKDDEQRDEFKRVKGPDFLSRLRGALDVPGLDLSVDFDPYGPVEAFPCEAAILLRRAAILRHQLGEKAPQLRDSAQALQVSPEVVRALLHVPEFRHGNRSFEALLDMSQLGDAKKLIPSLLPSSSHTELHADAAHLSQLVATDYPFPPKEREVIAQSIHERFLAEKRAQGAGPSPALTDWVSLPEIYKESSREQADDIAVKLRAAGLWFRKQIPGSSTRSSTDLIPDEMLEALAIAEHDRWAAERRRLGWIAAPCQAPSCRDDELRLHNYLVPWDELRENTKNLDRETIKQIPEHLAAADYEIFKP